MWLEYSNDLISFAGAYKLSFENDKTIVINYFSGKSVTLEFKSKEDRNKARNTIEKEIVRAVVKI